MESGMPQASKLDAKADLVFKIVLGFPVWILCFLFGIGVF